MSELENQIQETTENQGQVEDTAATPAAAENALGNDGAQQQAPIEETKPEKAPPPKWAIDEITSERARRREAERQLAEAARREAEYQQMLERIQKQTPPQGGETTERQPQPRFEQPAPSREAFQSEVRAEAARLKLAEDSAYVRERGVKDFPNFGETLRALDAMGWFETNDLTTDLIAVDKENAHKILEKIAKDPELAGAYTRMDTRARVAAFTRMAMSEQPTTAKTVEPPKPISKAPPPKPDFNPVGGAGDPNDLMDPDNKLSDDEWFRRYKAKHKV